VNGGVTVSGSTDPQYFLNSSGGNQARFKINDASSMIQIGSWTNIPVGFYTNGTERMRITSAGNVGIGNSNPSQKLSVAGAIESTSSSVAFYATVAGNYNQQNGASGTAWAYGSGGGNNAPGSASTTFGMHHWNGNSWKNPLNIDTAGRVTMPYQPAFTVYTTASTSVSNIIQFGGVQFNVGSHFNTSTGVFTAPVAGKYWFYWHLLTDRTTNIGEGYIDLYKNSAYHYRNYEYKEASGNTHVEFKGGVILDMAANDTVHLYYGYTVFGNIIANFHHCKFSGHLIG
jgi:hypothetical protein